MVTSDLKGMLSQALG